MPKLRVEPGFSITIPSDVVQALRLRVGQSVEVRFPEMSPPGVRGLGTATQWWYLSNQRLEDGGLLRKLPKEVKQWLESETSPR